MVWYLLHFDDIITDINAVPDIVTDKNVNDVYVLNTFDSSLIPAPQSVSVTISLKSEYSGIYYDTKLIHFELSPRYYLNGN